MIHCFGLVSSRRSESSRIKDQLEEQYTAASDTQNESAELSSLERLERFHEFRKLKTLQGTIKALQLVDHMDVSGLRQAISSVGLRSPLAPHDYLMKLQTMNAWVTIDPESAHDYCQELTDPFQRSSLGSVLFLQWGQSDSEAARAAVKASDLSDSEKGARFKELSDS
ncbi:MAG: hypothetical protein ACI9JZ_000643 [Lentimonas sp.]